MTSTAVHFKRLDGHKFLVINHESLCVLIKEFWRGNYIEHDDGPIPVADRYPCVAELWGYPGTSFEPIVTLTSSQDYRNLMQKQIDVINNYLSIVDKEDPPCKA